MDRNKIVDLIKDFVNEYGEDEGNGKCIILDESDTFFLNDPKEVKDFCKKDVKYIGACIYDVYADGVVIPKNMFGFNGGSNYSDGLKLTIYGTPTFLTSQAIGCSTGGTVTFADCTTPPDGQAYTGTNSPFYFFKGTLYVPSAGLTAWREKYSAIASHIQAIP
jgi:hypothetical protein